MLQLINSRIIIYFFLFTILSTLNNQNLVNKNFPKIDNIEILGLSNKEKKVLMNKLAFVKKENLFTLNKTDIREAIERNKVVEKYEINKNYPSSLRIKIYKTQILANVIKDDKKFYLGSNGKLISIDKEIKNIPYIFGNFKNHDLFELKKIIDNSFFNFNEINKAFYFKSGRWDLEIEDGILIRLPKNNLLKSFELFEDILINENFKNIKLIDLRQQNQVIISD